ncbi:hypothetical protein [Thiohalobacter thiocyanaticus]|nr:hypothetical protein [Thiohalobacter thiocyanaticus]
MTKGSVHVKTVAWQQVPPLDASVTGMDGGPQFHPGQSIEATDRLIG